MVKRSSIENEHKKNKEINATDKRNNEQKYKRFSVGKKSYSKYLKVSAFGDVHILRNTFWGSR